MKVLGLILLGLSSLGYPSTLELIRQIPHSGYSEGLDYHKGFLWHALPKQILKIDPKDGSILERHPPPTEYSESITWFNGKIWNVSFSERSIFEGTQSQKKLNFIKRGEVPEGRAWGITHDGKSLIVTGNYSRKLYFLNPNNLTVEKTIETEIADLEDLAYDGKGIWSSSFSQHRGKIFRIDPKKGRIESFFSLPDTIHCPVIDGLAFDGKNLWVTGKECASIYLFKKPLD